MKAEKIRSIFNDRLVAEDDAEAALRVEEVAQRAETCEAIIQLNALLAEAVKVQTAMMKMQSELLELTRTGQAFAMDPVQQGKHSFLIQLEAQKYARTYVSEHPELNLVATVNGGRR
jgi:hypothetical protein